MDLHSMMLAVTVIFEKKGLPSSGGCWHQSSSVISPESIDRLTFGLSGGGIGAEERGEFTGGGGEDHHADGRLPFVYEWLG